MSNLSKNTSLFSPRVPESQFHSNFSVLLKDDSNLEEKKVMEEWAKELLIRDGSEKFIKEFQTSFNSCFWEMYLNALFKSWNLEIDYSKPHPDFLISDFGGICIESVIANTEKDGIPESINAGKKTDYSVFPNVINEKEYEDFIRKSIIRLSNALLYKLRKYNDSYSKENYVKNKPYIIALTPFDRPGFWFQMDEPLLELLYGFRNKSAINKNLSCEKIERICSIQKDNGSDIDLGIFDDSQWSCVSGVIFSTTATYSKVQALSKSKGNGQYFYYSRYKANSKTSEFGCIPKCEYKETIDDGVKLFINLNAKNPIPIEFEELFPSRFYGYLEKKLLLFVQDGALLQRTQHGIKIKK